MPRIRCSPTRDANRSARRRARVLANPKPERIDRMAIWMRDNGICCICRCPVPREKFHLEHRKPLAAGGAHTADNLGVAHPGCNIRKGAKTQDELDQRPSLRRSRLRPKVRNVSECWPEGVDPDDVF